MPRLVLEEAVERTQWELLEDGSINEATISNIEVSSWTDPATQEVRKNLNWTFTIHTPGDWDGKRIWGNTSMLFNTNPNCKLRNWSQSILETELAANFELDTDDLVGRKCRILVGHKTYNDKMGEQKLKQFVADVMPPRKSVSSYDVGF